MKKPTPEERAQLRALFPQGAPRIDYREMLLDLALGRAPRTDGDGAGEVEPDGGDAAVGRAEDNPLIPIAISSEAPVLRYDWWDDEYYYEVLDHSAKSIILDYARDGMPFVASHRSWDADQQHGIVLDVAVGKDRILRGNVRMSRAQRSQEIAQDMRDGIRKKVSVGYIVGDQYDQTEKAKDGIPIRRYTAWMPIETSTVPVPADYAVGTGRAAAAEGQLAIARFLQLVPAAASRAATSLPATPHAPDSSAAPAPLTPAAPEAKDRNMEPDSNAVPASGNTAPVNVTEITARANEAAAVRVSNITAMASQHACTDKLTDWLRSGASEETVVREINTILTERMAKPITQTTGPQLSEKDQRRFSLARALMINTELQNEIRSVPGGAKVDFGFERELAQELGRTYSAQNAGNLLPLGMLGRAGIDSATGTTGGVFKFAQPGDFIPTLRNSTSVFRAGATVLPGLTGPLTFPKQTSSATAAWSAENPGSDNAVTNLLTTTVTLSFKSITAGTAFSRQALFSAASGNYDVEQIVQDDLTNVLGLAMDLGALNGSGSSNQPKGILQNTNIGSVALGTNGGTMTWNPWVDLETKIGQANANTARMAYITNSAQRGVAKKNGVLGNTASGVPIWTGTPGDMDGQVNGYRAIASEQVPSNLTKGTANGICSAVLFGAWQHLLIGLFGAGFETIVDPYSKKFQGMVEVSVWAYMDAQSRYDGAFAAVKDAL